MDKALQGAMQQTSDGQGGTMLTFGAGATHGVDIHGMANFGGRYRFAEIVPLDFIAVMFAQE